LGRPGRLLIAHGLIDENVHFVHTALMVDALVAAGKPYSLLVYPSERHGLRGGAAAEHFETSLFHFLLTNL
jgi:dipeptidyl-peptidase 9